MKLLKYFFTIVSLFSFCAVVAQTGQGSVTGVLYDSTSIKPIETATVAVFDLRDSAVVTFGLTDRNGEFELSRLSIGVNLRLLVSHINYGNKAFDFKLTESQAIKNFDTLFISSNIKEMDEVVVTWERPPITVRNDTIEFNADAFKARPGSMVEDLLKRLPGVEIINGEITANGRRVGKITIDGKQFFGSDPVTVMKNLPSMIIQSVQITDEKNEFGELAGSGEAVINLTLKEGAKKGSFGKVSGGYGNQNHYDGAALWNIFRDTMQLSIIAHGNNLSSPSFSMDELRNLGGFNRSSNSYSSYSDGSIGVNGIRIGGGRGITESRGGGFNLNHDVPNKLTLNLSYFYGHLNSDFLVSSNRENFLPDSSLYSFQQTSGNQQHHSHTVRSEIKWTTDTINSFEFKPTFELRNSHDFRSNSIQSYYSSSKDTGTFNNTWDEQSNNLSYSLSGVYKRRIKGKYLLSYSGRFFQNNELQEALNHIEQQEIQLIKTSQIRNFDNVSSGFNNTLHYNRDLAKGWVAGFNIRYNLSSSDREMLTYAVDSFSGPLLLPGSSAVFNNSRKEFIAGPYIGKNVKKWHFRFEPEFRNTEFTAVSLMHRPADVNRNYTYFNPKTTLSKRNAGNFMRLMYNYSLHIPFTHQLLPSVDNQDPTHIQTGNPNLEGYYVHNSSLMFSGRNPKSNLSYYTMGNVNFRRDGVIHTREYSPEGIQTISFVNVGKPIQDGYWFGNVRKGFKLKEKYDLNTTVFMSGNFSRSYTLVYNDLFRSGYYYLRPGASIGLVNYDKIDANISFFTNMQFNYTEGMSNVWNRSRRQEVSTGLWYAFTEKWSAEAKLNIISQPFYNQSLNFDDSYKLLNLIVTHSLLQNNALQIKLGVYDVFNENRNIKREAGENYVQNFYENAVSRYTMLTMVYNMHRFQSSGRTRRGFEF